MATPISWAGFGLRPSTSQLYVYARGSAGLIWLPVGFGVLTQQNLRFAGTYDATVIQQSPA